MSEGSPRSRDPDDDLIQPRSQPFTAGSTNPHHPFPKDLVIDHSICTYPTSCGRRRTAFAHSDQNYEPIYTPMLADANSNGYFRKMTSWSNPARLWYGYEGQESRKQ